jgi:hypothetical protein
MKSLTTPLIALAFIGLVAASPARADMIAFSYSWEALPDSVIPGGTGSVHLTPSVPGTSSATLDGAPNYITAAEVRTSSSATSPPDTFDTPFHLKLTLMDTASHESSTITFDGHIKGTLTATTSTLTSTFLNPVTQSRTLGGHLYTVTIAPSLANGQGPLPSPTAPAALFDARIQISTPSQDGQGGNSQAPEPCSLLLGATALAGFAVRRWWVMRNVG